jgi:hypothetical protein
MRRVRDFANLVEIEAKGELLRMALLGHSPDSQLMGRITAT